MWPVWTIHRTDDRKPFTTTRTPKTALVTGAGSGVGRGCAIALPEDGYSVILAGRRQQPLDDLSATLDSRSLAVPTDVTNPDPIQTLFSCIDEKFGHLDTVFNNAGTNVPSTLLDELTVEQWQTVVNTNLTGVFLCTREVFRLMKRQNSRATAESSTMVRFRPTYRTLDRPPSPLPDMPSPA